MVDFSDETTLLNSDANDGDLQPPTIQILPPSDYLWFDPFGTAYSGWHHQLILHMLALDESYITKSSQLQDLTFRKIQQWLCEINPTLLVDRAVIRAVAEEFQGLDKGVKHALRMAIPRVKDLTWISSKPDISTPQVQNDFEFWNSETLDPALFLQVEAELTAELEGQSSLLGSKQDISPSFPSFARLTRQKRVDGSSTISLGNSAESRVNENAKPQTKVTTPITPVTNEPYHSTIDSGVHNADNSSCLQSPLPTEPNSTSMNNLLQSTTPTKSILQTQTPTKPRRKSQLSIRERNSIARGRQISPSRKMSTPPAATRTTSVDDDVVIDDDNAMNYAPLYLQALVRSGYQPDVKDVDANQDTATDGSAEDTTMTDAPQESMASAGPSITTLTENPALKPDNESTVMIRRPDPSLYIQQSKYALIIPASEAKAFIAWFDPVHDTQPEKVEGYFWYCNRCYSTDNMVSGNRAPGKYSTKRSVEKHFQNAHKQKWTFVLPEPERGQGMGEIEPPSKEFDGVTDEEDEQHHSSEAASDRQLSQAPVAESSSPEPSLPPPDVGSPVSSSPREAYAQDYKYKPTEDDVKRTLFPWKDVFDSSSSSSSPHPNTNRVLKFKDVTSHDSPNSSAASRDEQSASEAQQLEDEAGTKRMAEDSKVSFAEKKRVKVYNESSPLNGEDKANEEQSGRAESEEDTFYDAVEPKQDPGARGVLGILRNDVPGRMTRSKVRDAVQK